MFEDEPPPAKPGYRLGENIDNWSVGDLAGLIENLRAEIARVEAEIGRRRGDRSTAESLFKP